MKSGTPSYRYLYLTFPCHKHAEELSNMAFKFLSVSSTFAVGCDLLTFKQLYVPAGCFQPYLDAVHASASLHPSSQSFLSISCRKISRFIVWRLSSAARR